MRKTEVDVQVIDKHDDAQILTALPQACKDGQVMCIGEYSHDLLPERQYVDCRPMTAAEIARYQLEQRQDMQAQLKLDGTKVVDALAYTKLQEREAPPTTSPHTAHKVDATPTTSAHTTTTPTTSAHTTRKVDALTTPGVCHCLVRTEAEGLAVVVIPHRCIRKYVVTCDDSSHRFVVNVYVFRISQSRCPSPCPSPSPSA